MKSIAAVLMVLLAGGLRRLGGPRQRTTSPGPGGAGRQDVVKAMEAFTAALEADPRNVAAAYERGRLLLVIGEPRNAVADFTTAILGDPAFGRAYVGRAQAKLALKDAGERHRRFRPGDRRWRRKDFEVHVARAAFRLHIGNIPRRAARTSPTPRPSRIEATALKIDQMLETGWARLRRTTPLSASSCFSSPDWNISIRMSEPPTNSPFT